jgi:hypothetical protein
MDMTIELNVAGGGGAIGFVKKLSYDGAAARGPVAVPKGYAGTLGTRTDNDTGVATLGAGHGIVNGTVDVYWGNGSIRYGMTASVSGNDVTLDGGLGANLPSQGTAVVVSPRVNVLTQIPLTVKALALQMDVGNDAAFAFARFTDSDANDTGTVLFKGARLIDIDGGDTVPIGDVSANVLLSNASTVSDGVFTAIWIEDATP